MHFYATHSITTLRQLMSKRVQPVNPDQRLDAKRLG